MNIIKSKLNNKYVSKIYHISDIHIRNFTRHDEYRYVFNNLYKHINKSNNDESLIVITGDLLHSKVDISPEGINLLIEFLNNLLSLCNVVMIPGNHDMNYSNLDRMDALTPIVNAINSNKLEYIKDTSIVNVANINFYHWSFLDKNTEGKFITPISNDKINICLYHGVITNSINCDNQIVQSNDSLDSNNFFGFDYVMLGDIHKTQFYDDIKTIGMVGSLIQQNHSEDLKHGIFEWDIINKKVEFINIDNNTQFHTIYVIDNVIQNNINIEDLKENLYLRISYANSDWHILEEIKNIYKQNKNILDLTYVKNEQLKNDIKLVDNSINLYDNNTRLLLIEKYLKDILLIEDDDLIKDVIELDCNINNSLLYNQKSNQIWNIIELKFNNMFSYGEDNLIVFDNINGINGLFAANASGKSSIVDVMLYCLFDKSTKTNKGSYVINNESKTFNCQMTLELNDTMYVIKRDGKLQKNGSVKVDVDFCKIEKDIVTSLNGKDRYETNKNIVDIFGDYDSFLLTNVSSQLNNYNIIDMGQKDRKDTLYKFLDISVFDKCNSIANEKFKNLNYIINQNNIDYDNTIKELQDKVYDINTINNNYNNNLKISNSKLLELNTKIDNEKSKLKFIEFNDDINKINDDLKKSLELIDVLRDKINSNTYKISNLEIENLSNIEKIENINIEFSEEQYDSIKNLINILENDLYKCKFKIEQNTIKYDKLKNLEYDKDCKYCTNNIFVKDAIEAKNELTLLNKEYTDILNKLQKNKDEFKLIENNKLIYNNKLNIININKKIESDIINLKNENVLTDERLIVGGEKISNLYNKIKLFEKSEKSILENKIINDNVNNLKLELNTLENTKNITINKINSNITEIELLKQKINNLLEKKQEYIKHLNDKKIHEIYLKLTNRNGLPNNIITNILPKIELEVNSILSQIVNFKIKLDNEDNDININIYYDDSVSNSSWPIELTSGMERFISSLAMRCSLINLSCLPRTNFLIIDEGLGTLDNNNLGQFNSVLTYIKTLFKFVILISHIDKSRDYVDNIIEIQRVKNKSKIYF